MTSLYWSQWDKDDLDSWQGKDLVLEEPEEYDIDFYLDEGGKDDDCCSCGNVCMDCLGLSCHDFM